MDGPTRRLPHVVRRTRPKSQLVIHNPRVPARLFRSLCVTEKIWIVALLPHQNQMRGGHVLRYKTTAARWARERVGRNAMPAAVIRTGVINPEVLTDVRLLIFEQDRAGLGKAKLVGHGDAL